MDHNCIHEELVQNHSLEITELQKEVQFKREKIDKLQKSVEAVDEKLDKLILQSERSDFDIDNRVTKLETSQKTMKWIVGFGLTAIGTATTVLAFIITIIH
jgi:hypothetical protein